MKVVHAVLFYDKNNVTLDANLSVSSNDNFKLKFKMSNLSLKFSRIALKQDLKQPITYLFVFQLMSAHFCELQV